MPDGYAKIKWEYDIHGNSTQVTYHGVREGTGPCKKLYHGWKSRYDEQGNETATIFIGLDQKADLDGRGYAISRR